MDAIVCACTPVEVVTSFAAELMETAHRLSTQTCATPATLPHQSEFTIPSDNRRSSSSGAEAGQRQWSDHVDVCRWVVPPQCQDILVRAHAHHQAVAGGCRFYALSNNGRFGRAALSKHRVHADFFCQLAIQLAYAIETTPPSRAASSVELAATYESASTRAFRQGRTETVRSATQEMKTLIQHLMTSFQRNATATSAGNDARNICGDIRRAFQAAQRKHLQLVKEASTGAGVDRHLMGLRIAQTAVLQRPMPSVLQQGPIPLTTKASSGEHDTASVERKLVEAIKKAETFVLLTSQMVGDTYLGGFAHVSPVGYGVCYYPLKDTIRACVSSFAPLANVVEGAVIGGAPPTTDATRFGDSVLRCMDDLYDVVVIGKFSTSSSRL